MKRRAASYLRRVSWSAVAILVLSCGGTTRAQVAPAPPIAGPPPIAAVEAWVKDLDSDRFLDREIATQRLIDCGQSVIPSLIPAIWQGSKEASTRAMFVLQELTIKGDRATSEAARDALAGIADDERTPASQRARDVLARVAPVWSERAIEVLRERGAIIVDRAPELLFSNVAGYISIEFSDQWRGDEDDLALLRRVQNVSELVVVGGQVTDSWMEPIAEMTGVTAVTIKRAGITDAGVERLSRVKNVGMLSLLYVPISDRSLEHLNRLRGVQLLRIYGGRVTREGVERLQLALPGTKVDYRRGAFLGVGCQTTLAGCVITTVRPESAAEQAGLMVGDVIAAYGGQPVQTFEQLTELISRNEAGETIAVEVMRVGGNQIRQLTLGEWPART